MFAAYAPLPPLTPDAQHSPRRPRLPSTAASPASPSATSPQQRQKQPRSHTPLPILQDMLHHQRRPWKPSTSPASPDASSTGGDIRSSVSAAAGATASPFDPRSLTARAATGGQLQLLAMTQISPHTALQNRRSALVLERLNGREGHSGSRRHHHRPANTDDGGEAEELEDVIGVSDEDDYDDDGASSTGSFTQVTEGDGGAAATEAHQQHHHQHSRQKKHVKQIDSFRSAENKIRVVRGMADLQNLIEVSHAQSADVARRTMEHPFANTGSGTNGSNNSSSSGTADKGGCGGGDDGDKEKDSSTRAGPSSSSRRSKVQTSTLDMGASFAMPGATGEKRLKAGRKPMRVISAELHEKLQALRTNQTQWEVFNARISLIKNAQRSDKDNDIIHQNITSIVYEEPEEKQSRLEDNRDRHEQHRQEVYDAKRRLYHDIQKRKRKALEASAKEHKLRGAQAKLGAQQHKWIYLVAIASRLYVLKQLLQTRHNQFFEYKRQTRAARVIQTAWRAYKQRQYEKRKKRAMVVLSRFFAAVMQHRRHAKKVLAANIMLELFREVHDVSKLSKIIKKYRYSVIKAQRLAKSYVQARRAQLQLLVMQWDRTEAVLRARLLEKGEQEALGKSNAKGQAKAAKKGAQGKKKGKEGNAKDDHKDSNKHRADARVPDAVKLQLLDEALAVNRKRYRKRYWIYRDALLEYQRQVRRRRETEDVAEGETATLLAAPVKPYFRTLLSAEEISTMVEKAMENM
ncbi:hypothetical protein RI367_001307 [Sorochytrium milnesiophthora]